MSAIELLPCPFCGGEPSYGQSLTGGQTWFDHVECLSCGAMCQSCSSMDDAKEAWNKRTLPEGVTGYLKIHPDVLKSWNEGFEE